MKTKKSYCSRALVLLMAFMLVFTMMPSGMWGGAETAYASTTVEWAGAANANAENNTVISTELPTAKETSMLKWATFVGHENWGAYYAGNTAIANGYIYVTGNKYIYKINTENGNIEKSATITDWTATNYTDGILIIGEKVYISNANTIKSFNLDLGEETTVASGQKFGNFHSILQGLSVGVKQYLYCNGVFVDLSDNSIKTIKTASGSEENMTTSNFAWSSGALVGNYFYVTEEVQEGTAKPYTYKRNVYAIDLANGYVVDTYTKEITAKGNTSGQTVYDSASKRIFFGSRGEKKLMSLKCGDNGKFVENSYIECETSMQTVTSPVVYNNKIYLVGQSSGAVNVFKYTANESGDEIEKLYDLTTASTSAGDKKVTTVQSNPILSTANGNTVLYFSAFDGDLYMMKDNGESGELIQLADTPNINGVQNPNAYEQIAIDKGGNIYCYNESGYLFCYTKAEASMTELTASVGGSAQAFTQSFDSQIQEHELAVDRATTTVDFAFTVTEGASVKVGETAITDGTYQYNLAQDAEQAIISFTVSKGKFERTYKVTVRKKSTDTTIHWAVNNDTNTVPTSSTAVTEAQTKINTGTSKLVWIAAPTNGTISCEEVSATDTYTKTAPTSTFAAKLYFKSGVNSQNIFKVTATAEDGTTTATYYLVVSKDGTYTPIEKKVNVTISNKAELVYGSDTNKTLLAGAQVTAKDLDNSCTVDVSEVLYAAHEAYYEGGAAAGYASETTAWGLSLTKLWGDTSGSFGYWLNNDSCWSLGDTVKDGDQLKAFVYKDAVGWSDIYTFFENAEYNAKTGEEVTLTLKQSVYNAEYALETSGFEGATIKILKSNSTKDYVTDANGEVKLTFASAGTYTVTASKADGSIVPSACTVKVTKDGGASTPPTVAEGSKVSFTLRGDIRHDSDVDNKVHTLKGGGLTTWISLTKVDIETGDTVGTVFKKVLDQNGFTYVGLENNYISEITKPATAAGAEEIVLAEKDNSSNSGWMYTVNGTHPEVPLNDYLLTAGDVIVFHYTDDYTKEESASSFGGGAASATTEEMKNVTTDTKTATTTSPTEVKVAETTGADGSKEAVATVTVSAENQKEILKQVEANKSKEIVLNVSKDSVKDATKVDVQLDKSFLESAAATGASLTVKTALGDKTYTNAELKELAAAATGKTVSIEIVKSAEQADAEAKIAQAKELVGKMSLIARSSKTAKKNVKVTLKMSKETASAISELKDLGYTVKYKFYRSTKKSSKYVGKLTKQTKTYTNTEGTKGTRYYYKARVQVFDKDGKLVAQTALKQCKYATRIFG